MSYHWMNRGDPEARPTYGDMAEIVEAEAEARKRDADGLRGLLYALPVGLGFWALFAVVALR
ncbi:hypothetical protein KY084_12730 [Stakelama sp. CBK3Z-3]|uniref:YqzE family protein n=1 Tax=Stakelama flava TaxID=2860338 RepID=A0ABS6XNH8_9SPHN|nr:hypothetical protein [Stakelama flava]MBW4331736.1 hypothetical protein [Stakelama flava]